MPSRIALFDVNETLLDLNALDPHFQEIFGDAGARKSWFQRMLQLSLTVNALDEYRDFSDLGRVALEMTAQDRQMTISDQQKSQIAGAIRSLPPHRDVVENLQRLRYAGFRLATLTNSAKPVVDEQLRKAGIYELFAAVLSVDSVRRFKPAAETYHMAAKELNVKPSDIRLIAAHGWDVWGAMHAGCAAAFVARPGQLLIPLAPRPEIVGNDLREVVDAVLRIDA